MTKSIQLFLDLGDVITKGIAVKQGQIHRFLLPSVVARRLLSGTEKKDNLLLDDKATMIRTGDFDPSKYPRTRSYPREESYLNQIQSVPHARFAGRIAVALGADREILGRHQTEENVDALVHKSLFKVAEGCDRVDIIFILDVGAKANAIASWAKVSPRTVRFYKWKLQNSEPVSIELSANNQVIDAAVCAIGSLPPEFSLQKIKRFLLIDIGYFRTKLALISSEGCEYQEQIDELGVSDCVRQVLRDGQEYGLVEDEYAVIRALEKSLSTIEVAGRRFDIHRTLESTKRVLEEELEKKVQKTVIEQCGRKGVSCQAVAVVGGGSAIVGEGLVARVKTTNLGLNVSWVAKDTKFFLLEGARKVCKLP